MSGQPGSMRPANLPAGWVISARPAHQALVERGRLHRHSEHQCAAVGGADCVECRDDLGGQLDADRGRVLPQVGGA